ncbi:MAG: 16S rRNA (adenine(1518)-N(6)/adenine(1519)-N(6))-dimethyltransferase [Chloroflexi bacterium]|nr:16S rRNA (adenine(1518)-N(6)/adenine(1519)-N(6))-dimethyltransferase [Chloroflexota bacterium]
MNPKAILQQYGLEPKKSLGQNFLFDDQVLGRIVAAASLTATDHVLEIGPGLGHLTEHLANAAAAVTAVELDQRYLPILHDRLGHLPQVRLIHGDILEQNLALLFPQQSYKVVANVPYYITGAILRHLLSAQSKPSLMVMTVQKEVAQRLAAKPGDPEPDGGQCAILRPGPSGEHHSGRGFLAAPRGGFGHCAVGFIPGTAFASGPRGCFFRVVKAGFSQKRKQVKNNLLALGMGSERVAAALQKAHIDGQRRAETLTLPEWVALYQNLSVVADDK